MSQLSDLSGLADVSAVLAWVAGALLLLAGAAKLRWPAGTVQALRDAGLPGSAVLVRSLGAGEVVVGAGVLLAGGPLAAAVASCLYAGFTVFSIRQRRSADASCGCFGEERTPVSGLHITVNAVATVGALVAALTGAVAPAVLLGPRPVVLAGTLLLVAVAAWLVRLGLTAGADLQAAVALHPGRTGTTA